MKCERSGSCTAFLLLKYFLLLFLMIVLIPGDMISKDEDIEIYSETGKAGFIDKKGNTVIDFKFDYARSFSDGLAFVKFNKQYGFIDKTGKIVINCNKDVESFHEGLAIVRINNKHGYMDKTGKSVIEIKYEYAEPFSEGLAAVRFQDKWGYIDKSGREVIECKYDRVTPFSEGLAYVEISRESYQGKKYKKFYGYINKKGRTVIELYGKAYGFPFSEGLANVFDKTRSKWYYINKQGKITIDAYYDFPGSFHNGLAAVRINPDWYYINKTGQRVLKPEYKFENAPGSFQEGLLLVDSRIPVDGRQETRYGYIDKTGRNITGLKYVNAACFYEGLAAVCIKDKWGYIDKTGKEVIALKYGYAVPFQEGLAVVRPAGKYGLRSKKTGRIIVQPEYSEIKNFINGYAVMKKDLKYGVIDKKGREVIPAGYDGLECVLIGWDNDKPEDRLIFIAEKNKKYSIINIHGKELAPFKYDMIKLDNFDGLFTVFIGGQCGMINRNGREIIPVQYNSLSLQCIANKRFIIAEQDKKFGLIDITGKDLTDIKYDSIKMISIFWEDLVENRQADKLFYFLAEKQKKYGLLGLNGNELTSFKYDSINFDNGCFAVVAVCSSTDYAELGNGAGYTGKIFKYGCVRKNGREVIPPLYDEVILFQKDFVIVKSNNKYGLYNLDGKKIYTPEYEGILSYNGENGLGIVMISNITVMISAKGERLNYEPHWEEEHLKKIQFSENKMYVFADVLNLRKNSDPDSEIIDKLRIGTEVKFLSYHDYFYRDGSGYIKDVYQEDADFMSKLGSDYGVNADYKMKDRWVQIKIPGIKKQGYVLESYLADSGFYQDLDNDGDRDFVLIKNHSYNDLQQEELARTRKQKIRKTGLVSMRFVRNNTLSTQITIKQLIRNLNHNINMDKEVKRVLMYSGLPSPYDLNINFIRLPDKDPQFFFLTLFWEGDLNEYEGSSGKVFYYFKNDMFRPADIEYSYHKGGAGFNHTKKLSYDPASRTVIMKENYQIYDHGYEKEGYKLYSWDKSKIEFVFSREKVTREIDGP